MFAARSSLSFSSMRVCNVRMGAALSALRSCPRVRAPIALLSSASADVYFWTSAATNECMSLAAVKGTYQIRHAQSSCGSVSFSVATYMWVCIKACVLISLGHSFGHLRLRIAARSTTVICRKAYFVNAICLLQLCLN